MKTKRYRDDIEVEAEARRVTCPVCGAKRGKKCSGPTVDHQAYSHTGRLKKARGEL